MQSETANRRQKTCLFCGAQLRSKSNVKNAKTDEHVISAWLQNYLGITGKLVTPTRVRIENRQIIDMRQHVMGAFVAGTVCSDCNCGWMSDLEGNVKPILIGLIDDPMQLEKLSQSERFIVARWTLKTAAVLNRCSTYGSGGDGIGRAVPDDHMRILASGGLPGDVFVVGAGFRSNRAFDFLQYALWTTPANSTPLLVEDRDRSYKIALSFRDLVLMVAYYPSSDYTYGINTHHYVRLWTGSRRWVRIDHPMDDSPADSDKPHLEGLLRNIFIISSTLLRLIENYAFTRLIQL